MASLLRSSVALGDSNKSLQRLIVLGLAAGLNRHGCRLDSVTTGTTGRARAMLHGLIQEAIATAQDDSASLGQREQSIQLLGYQGDDTVIRVLPDLLDSSQPTRVQSAAIRALANLDRADVSSLLLANWKSATPSVRQDILGALFSRPLGIQALLNAINDQTVLAAEIDASRRNLLLSKVMTAGHNATVSFNHLQTMRGGFPVSNGYLWRTKDARGIVGPKVIPPWAKYSGDPDHDNYAHVEPGVAILERGLLAFVASDDRDLEKGSEEPAGRTDHEQNRHHR